VENLFRNRTLKVLIVCASQIFTIFTFHMDVSHSFEMDAEYRSIPTERGFELIDPLPIDSEYQSDLLTYSTTATDVLSFSSPRHFYLSAGSLSATQFDFQLRAQVLEALNPNLVFKFLRTEQENYEEAVRSSFVELQARLAESSIWFAAYGTLARLKKEDDVGFAVLWRRDENHELRLFATFADFTRSDRNDAGDFFVDSGPMAIGLKWVRNRSKLYRELLLRRESAVEWRDPVSSRSYTFAHRFASGIFRRTDSDDDRSWLALRWQWDSKHTGIISLDATGSATARDVVDRDRHQIELRRNFFFDEKCSTQLGVLWVARSWRDESGRELQHHNLSPFLSVRLDSGNGGFEMGIEATKFEALGDLSLGSATVRTEAIESRLNGRYYFTFENDATLSLALTFDVDRAEGGAFEGGHGKFQTTF
jgi:hypothetical protein